MGSEHLDVVSRNLRITTEDDTDLRANQHTQPDTRRFASIFPLEVPEASVDCDDATDEEHDDDDPSRWEFIAVLDEDASTIQVESITNVDEGSTLSAAEQVVAGYRAVHGSDHVPECSTAEMKEKAFSQVPDDQRSMYTLATSTDTQSSTMDMMWRPKPKIHMHRTDRHELIQAQEQAITMMHSAGLKPTNKIQCRRRGCADILPNVEALKYHIHIHNIADTTIRRNGASPCTSPKPSVVESSTSSLGTSKNHSRSKSSLDAHQRCIQAYSPPRKLSACNFFPALFSSRENTSEAEHVPSLTTVSKALASDPSPSKSGGPPRVRNDSEIASTRPSTSSRGRRKRKRGVAVSGSAECNPSIAMLLSPPPSPDMRGRPVFTPRTNSPVQFLLDPTMDDENAPPASKTLTRLRSPIRALSPTRAMSPIRDGIRRILSIGCSVELTDK